MYTTSVVQLLCNCITAVTSSGLKFAAKCMDELSVVLESDVLSKEQKTEIINCIMATRNHDLLKCIQPVTTSDTEKNALSDEQLMEMIWDDMEVKGLDSILANSAQNTPSQSAPQPPPIQNPVVPRTHVAPLSELIAMKRSTSPAPIHASESKLHKLRKAFATESSATSQLPTTMRQPEIKLRGDSSESESEAEGDKKDRRGFGDLLDDCNSPMKPAPIVSQKLSSSKGKRSVQLISNPLNPMSNNHGNHLANPFAGIPIPMNEENPLTASQARIQSLDALHAMVLGWDYWNLATDSVSDLSSIKIPVTFDSMQEYVKGMSSVSIL